MDRVRDAIIISPHLDDGLFSLSAFLRDFRHIILVSVFTKECPFRHVKGEDYKAFADMKLRKMEDAQAVALINATLNGTTIQYLHLNLPDTLFRTQTDAQTERILNKKLTQITRKYKDRRLFCPLAIGGHPDHTLVFRVCNTLFPHAFYYFDFPYSTLKINTAHRLRQLKIKTKIATGQEPQGSNETWDDYYAYYAHPMYRSTPPILRWARIAYIAGVKAIQKAIQYIMKRKNPQKEYHQDQRPTDPIFKYHIMTRYKTQLKPLFKCKQYARKVAHFTETVICLEGPYEVRPNQTKQNVQTDRQTDTKSVL